MEVPESSDNEGEEERFDDESDQQDSMDEDG